MIRYKHIWLNRSIELVGFIGMHAFELVKMTTELYRLDVSLLHTNCSSIGRPLKVLEKDTDGLTG